MALRRFEFTTGKDGSPDGGGRHGGGGGGGGRAYPTSYRAGGLANGKGKTAERFKDPEESQMLMEQSLV